MKAANGVRFPDATPRAQLAAVSLQLRAVHESLVEAVRAGFEKLHGRIEGTGALLALVLEDPLFAWLRPMSALLAELDGAVDDPEAAVDGRKSREVRDRLARWTSVTGEPDEFAEVYRVYLQSDPKVVMAHAALKRALAAIPPDELTPETGQRAGQKGRSA
jgi:hypothetical protein